MKVNPGEIPEIILDNGDRMPIGSPRRPDRDIMADDAADMEQPLIRRIADKYGVHPAIIALKWAIGRGTVPIPFSLHNYEANLQAAAGLRLTEEEMKVMDALECGNRLVKGQVFLWEGAKDWHDLWDEEGVITSCPDAL